MFSMCSELTPRARIPDSRIPQFMQPCLGAYRDVPADQVSYIGHGALAHSEADKRRQRKSPHKSGDFPESNMNDQSLILQTCLDRRVNGATNQQV